MCTNCTKNAHAHFPFLEFIYPWRNLKTRKCQNHAVIIDPWIIAFVSIPVRSYDPIKSYKYAGTKYQSWKLASPRGGPRRHKIIEAKGSAAPH